MSATDHTDHTDHTDQEAYLGVSGGNWGGGSEMICSVCRNNIQSKELVYTSPCKHTFHFMCIRRWLAEKENCPCCRKEIKMQTIDPQFEELQENIANIARRPEPEIIYRYRDRDSICVVVVSLLDRKQKESYFA